jgi:hypothetical protein
MQRTTQESISSFGPKLLKKLLVHESTMALTFYIFYAMSVDTL